MPPICPNLTVGPHCFCLNADIHSDDEDADEDADDDIHSDGKNDDMDENVGPHCFFSHSLR